MEWPLSFRLMLVGFMCGRSRVLLLVAPKSCRVQGRGQSKFNPRLVREKTAVTLLRPAQEDGSSALNAVAAPTPGEDAGCGPFISVVSPAMTNLRSWNGCSVPETRWIQDTPSYGVRSTAFTKRCYQCRRARRSCAWMLPAECVTADQLCGDRYCIRGRRQFRPKQLEGGSTSATCFVAACRTARVL